MVSPASCIPGQPALTVQVTPPSSETPTQLHAFESVWSTTSMTQTRTPSDTNRWLADDWLVWAARTNGAHVMASLEVPEALREPV